MRASECTIVLGTSLITASPPHLSPYSVQSPTASTLLLPGASRDHCGQRGTHTAAQPDQHTGEAAFTDVVARAGDQRLVNGLALVREILVAVAGAGVEIRHRQVLFKRPGRGDHIAFAVHCE